jgi:hypothetical protein
MEFRQENAEMAGSSNDFLNERFLVLKVRLVPEDSFIATVKFIRVAFAWTFSLKIPCMTIALGARGLGEYVDGTAV